MGLTSPLRSSGTGPSPSHCGLREYSSATECVVSEYISLISFVALVASFVSFES